MNPGRESGTSTWPPGTQTVSDLWISDSVRSTAQAANPFLSRFHCNRSSDVFAPHYNRITQFGLDTQFTTGSWLFKLEAIHRGGAQDSLVPQEDYSAFVIGAEHTIYAVFDSDADVTLFAEWAHDGRGRRATNAFENDVFLAARLGLNDEYDTEFVASIVKSLDTDSRVLNAEFNRRISDSWSLSAQVSAFSGIGMADRPLYEVRRDSFASVNLDYSF